VVSVTCAPARTWCRSRASLRPPRRRGTSARCVQLATGRPPAYRPVPDLHALRADSTRPQGRRQHECGTRHRRERLPEGQVGRRARCGAALLWLGVRGAEDGRDGVGGLADVQSDGGRAGRARAVVHRSRFSDVALTSHFAPTLAAHRLRLHRREGDRRLEGPHHLGQGHPRSRQVGRRPRPVPPQPPAQVVRPLGSHRASRFSSSTDSGAAR